MGIQRGCERLLFGGNGYVNAVMVPLTNSMVRLIEEREIVMDPSATMMSDVRSCKKQLDLLLNKNGTAYNMVSASVTSTGRTVRIPKISPNGTIKTIRC